MNLNNIFQKTKERPKCVGTGLIALDIVINNEMNDPPKLWAGGSCGNVLTILSFLGWESYPVARLVNDLASDHIVKDMESWNVKTEYMFRGENGSTPIIIERIGRDRTGHPKHKFEWICPNCGSWLPRYKPVLTKEVESLTSELPIANFFYFDRASRSSVELAKYLRSNGALVMFEPSSSPNDKLFQECLEVADIVKYSYERLGHIGNLIPESIKKPMEVVTLGEDGIQYRLGDSKGWKHLPGYQVEEFRDAAGAGDWCSAGIAFLFGKDGRTSFEKADENDIKQALNIGQALASINCQYDGARGSMYSLDRKQIIKKVLEIIRGGSSMGVGKQIISKADINHTGCFCPNCITNRSK